MKKIILFFKQNWEYFLWIIISILIYKLSFELIIRFAFSITTAQVGMFVLFFSYSLTFLLAYICSDRFKKYVNDHNNTVAMLALVFSLATFSFSLAINTIQSTSGGEDAIKQSNNFNYKFIDVIENESASSSAANFFIDLESDSYEKNLAYIARNYPLDCLNSYENAIIQIKIFNSLIRQRLEIAISKAQFSTPSRQFDDLDKLNRLYFNRQLSVASSTRVYLGYAINKCQDFKQGK